MKNYRGSFTDIEIVDDKTNGLIDLSLVGRIGQDRKTKIKNNFTGHLAKASAPNLNKILNILNKDLPEPKNNEVVVGIITSGLVMSSALAMVRGTSFNYTTAGDFVGREKAFSFSEEHRNGKEHFLYGISKKDSIVIIEDEVFSGNGLIQLIKGLQKDGIEVAAVCTVVEVLNFSAAKKIKEETGLDLVSLIKIRVK